MKVGDYAYFYHSSCKVPSIVGVVKIIREAAIDETALDPQHAGYDKKSTTREDCPWVAVRVRLETIFESPIPLRELKARAK